MPVHIQKPIRTAISASQYQSAIANGEWLDLEGKRSGYVIAVDQDLDLPMKDFAPECQGICPKCRINPVAASAVWCRECLNEKERNKRKSRKGLWYKNLTTEQRKKVLARKIFHMAKRLGKIKRQPCEVCGKLETQGHHHNGYEREHVLDVRWLCNEHHWALERWQKKVLTKDGKRLDGKNVTQSLVDA